MNDLDHFLQKYETATNSHNFDNLASIIADNATYWFSDGSYEGIDAIRTAFESTWNMVKDEVYTISDVRWLAVSETTATCIYNFSWQGIIDGKPSSGGGRGTNVSREA